MTENGIDKQIISVGYRVKSYRGVYSFLAMTGKEILNHNGKISHEKAVEKAHKEYNLYKDRIKDRITRVERDFIRQIESETKSIK